MPLSDFVKEKIIYVASYVQDSITDWFLIKREIIRQIPGFKRQYTGFSKRHKDTKKMIINDTEKEAMKFWELITGVEPVIDPKRIHDPSWVKRPKGWALNGGKEKILQKQNEGKKTESPSDNH